MQQTQTFSTARGEYGLMTHDDHRTISQGKSFQQAKKEGFSVESLWKNLRAKRRNYKVFWLVGVGLLLLSLFKQDTRTIKGHLSEN